MTLPASEETVPATDAGITDEAVRKACKRIYGDTWSLLEAIKLRDLINDTISATREHAVRECAEIAFTGYQRWATQDQCIVACDITACEEIGNAILSLIDRSAK